MSRTYLVSIREYAIFLQSLLEHYLGAEAYSNNTTELVALLFEYKLQDNEHRTRIHFIDTLCAYGLIEDQAEHVFAEAVQLLLPSIQRMFLVSRDQYRYNVEPYNDDTFLIRQTDSLPSTTSPTQSLANQLESQLIQELNNGAWMSERYQKFYPLLREYAARQRW
jgi:hypothetical protein